MVTEDGQLTAVNNARESSADFELSISVCIAQWTL